MSSLAVSRCVTGHKTQILGGEDGRQDMCICVCVCVRTCVHARMRGEHSCVCSHSACLRAFVCVRARTYEKSTQRQRQSLRPEVNEEGEAPEDEECNNCNQSLLAGSKNAQHLDDILRNNFGRLLERTSLVEAPDV